MIDLQFSCEFQLTVSPTTGGLFAKSHLVFSGM